MNWWELQQKNKPDGKPDYQECEITFTALDGEPKAFGSVFFQNATMLEADGIRSAPCSVMFFADTPEENKKPALNVPVKCRVALKPDTSQYAVNGMKYTVLLGDKPAGKGGFGGRGGYKPSPQEQYEKRLTMMLSYAKDCFCAGKIEKSVIMSTVAEWSDQMDVMIAMKFETPKT